MKMDDLKYYFPNIVYLDTLSPFFVIILVQVPVPNWQDSPSETLLKHKFVICQVIEYRYVKTGT
jgi:hypothetical protein